MNTPPRKRCVIRQAKALLEMFVFVFPNHLSRGQFACLCLAQLLLAAYQYGSQPFQVRLYTTDSRLHIYEPLITSHAPLGEEGWRGVRSEVGQSEDRTVAPCCILQQDSSLQWG